MVRYIIRLDDISPFMDRQKWLRMEGLLDKFGVKPLVGIIPAVADPEVMIDSEDVHFWEKAHEWERKGWVMALHGYDHVYISTAGMEGFNPIWKRSEFAGVSIDEQRGKIRKGVAIFHENGLEPKCFFAPSHTFDKNTLEALRIESGIRMISDTIGRYPYRKGDFVFVPQIVGHCMKIHLSGVYTFCFHPSMMNQNDFERLEEFLSANRSHFIGFDEISVDNASEKLMADKLISWLYFTIRKLRGIH